LFNEDFWETRDETNNFEQNYDHGIVKEEKRIEVVEEIRLEVDALMREELKNLRTVSVKGDFVRMTLCLVDILGDR
jgi:hypothetical protein